jgi:MYXO-CTERM domain-containing protein
MYKRYADTTGQRVAISSNNGQWDGTAGTDSSKANAIIVLGNNLGESTASYNITVSLTHLDQASYLVSNNQVRALVERMPETGATISAPTTVSTQNYAVTNNQVSIPISWTSASDGYVITLTGTPGTGGSGTGGTATGGTATGGRATGGTPTGGQATGGKATGGTSTGGIGTGGRATGGIAVGGTGTGGVSTTSGGASTGGRASGGTLVSGGTGGAGGANVSGSGGQGGGAEESCNCRTARGRDTGAGWLGALGLLLLGRARRRTPGKRLSAGKTA